MNIKLYITAIGDVLAIFLFALTDLDPQLRTIGLLIGVVVGVVTGLRMWQDYKVKKMDGKIKSLDLKKKEEEFRRYMEKKYS